MDLKTTKFKLILGLGNKDTKSALDMALLYAHAGVRFIDSAPEIIPDIIKTLAKAGFNLDDFTLCASVPVLGDIHGRKAHISPEVCSGCSLCAQNCPTGAVFKNRKGKCEVDLKKCIGCGICKKVTNCYAISFEYGNDEMNSLKELVKSGKKLDMAELHASISNEKQIIEDLEDILSFFKGDISICINRKQFPPDSVVKLLNKLKEKFLSKNPAGKFYVQADGASMNGGNADCASTLECIQFAKELYPFGFDLIISGGTNFNTPMMLNNAFKEEITPCIAFGTYARKLVSGLGQKEALNKAKELFDETNKYN